MNLVEDDEFVFVIAQKQRRIGELSPVFPRLKVKIDRGNFGGDRMGQRRLSHLPGTNERNRRLLGEGIRDRGASSAENHPCIFSTLWRICKELHKYSKGAYTITK